MDLVQEPDAFETFLNSIHNAPVTEPEPENERDSVYYFDNIVFKVCDI